MAVIAALLRAQFLSMRRGPRRGRVLAALTASLWYGIWTGAGLAAFVWASRAAPGDLASVLPVALLLVCGYWQVIPIVSVSTGSSLEMRKLLAYPIPAGQLFRVELLLRLAAGLEMVLVLAGGAAGLMFNRSVGPRVPVIPALAVFALFNLLLASGVRSLLERLLTRRRVREILVLLLLLLWMIPRLMFETGYHSKALDVAINRLAALGLPWTAAAHAALFGSAPAAWLSLACWTAAAAWFGHAQFRRSLRYDFAAASATDAGRDTLGDLRPALDRFYRLPSLVLRDPLAALVEKELRSLARTPRFRLVFIMGFTFGLVVWLPLAIGRGSARYGLVGRYFLPVVSVYALTLLGQVTYWNCFGFDRSAAAIYYATPPPLVRTLVAKNLASLVYFYLEIAILTAITLALRLLSGWQQLAETLAVTLVVAIYMLALGNIASVEYPRSLNPERVSQGGAAGRFQALIFLLYPLALVPVLLAYLARYAFASQWAFNLVLVLAAAVASIVYWFALESAAATAVNRREQILSALSTGEGPAAS